MFHDAPGEDFYGFIGDKCDRWLNYFHTQAVEMKTTLYYHSETA